MNSQVWLNGKLLGQRPYGYIPFEYDLTGGLQQGQNTIAVRVDSSKEPSARWYHGCGIYAPVRLIASESVAIESNGIWVRTVKADDGTAELLVSARVANHSDQSIDATVAHRLTAPNGSQSKDEVCLLYTSPSPRDQRGSRMPSSA